MRKLKLSVLTVGLLFFCKHLIAQTDTAFLATVEVVDHFIPPDTLDMNWKPGDLSAATALFSQELIYLRSTGPGSLSTFAYRGNAPHQMPVLWQGINIQNSMNGVVDLSLLPANFYRMSLNDDQTITGGHAQNHRALSFSSANKPDALFTAGISLGTYGHRQLMSKFNYQSKIGRTVMHFSHQNAKHNFRYKNITQAGQPVKRLENAAFKSTHLSLDHFVQFNQQNLAFHFLYSAADRQIPPSLTEANHSNSQQDTSLRFTLIYSLNFLKDSFSYQPAFMLDINQYLRDKHITHSHVHQFGYLRRWNHAFHSEFKYILDAQTANSTSFSRGLVSRLRHDFILQSSLARGKYWNFFENTRWTQSDQFTGAFFYQLGAQFDHRYFEVEVKGGRSWQFPTLNDLYWPISGNLNLRPEKSDYLTFEFKKEFPLFPNWAADAGLSLEWKRVDDYILWRPVSSAFWSPSNVKEVEIRSIDPNIKLRRTWDKSSFSVKSSLQYLSAISRKVYDASQSGALGRQLIYMPEFQFRNQFEMNFYRKWIFSLMHSYIGERSTTRDHSHLLMPAHLLSFSVQREFRIAGSEYTLSLNADNILNTQYQLIAYRPMPGITAYFNLIIKLI